MSKYGLLRVVPGAELPSNDIASKQEDPEIFHSELERHIRSQWEANRNAKLRVEEGLLEDLRAKNGEYHPQKLQDIRQMGGSEIYMMVTATKQRAASSWIKDIILPEDEKAWGISPTPIPDLPQWAEDAVLERVQSMGGDQQQFNNLRELVRQEMDAQAKVSCENMERLMEDQLVEAKWGQTIAELVDDFTTFSSAILKGPMLKKRKTLKWQQGFGRIKPKVTEEKRIEYKRVSPFDIYPSPESENINDGSLIEHIRFRRGELYSMLGVPGYLDHEIRGVLDEYEGGKRIWLWNDSERNENENKHHWWRHHRNGLIDGLHYWGSVQGRHLKRWGITGIEDDLAEYQVDAILIGRYIIRISINNDPLARRPYQQACYDPVPGGFWGNSIRYLMNDIQELCNATARALVNNMAMASGPQVEVNYERLSPLENELEMYPWKIWQTRGSEIGGSNTLQFFQPESNAEELLLVYEKFEIKADDATSIPRYSHGNQDVGGAATTSSGLSMLMNSAAKGIKAAIGNFDFGITRPALEQLYFYNMITTKDPSVQGDAKVVARGANALLLRDMAQQRRNEFLGITNNSVDLDIIGIPGRAELLRQVAKDFEMDGIVPTKELVLAKVKQAAENPPPDPEMVKIQTEAQTKDKDREAMMMKHQAELQSRAGEGGSDQARLASDERVKMAQISASKEKDMQTIATKEASETRVMSEETVRIRQRNRDNLENDIEKHAMTIESQENKAQLDRKAEDRRVDKEAKIAESQSGDKETGAGEGGEAAPAQPMILNVVIDNTGGKIKKTIEINRDASGKASLLTSMEEPVEETDDEG